MLRFALPGLPLMLPPAAASAGAEDTVLPVSADAATEVREADPAELAKVRLGWLPRGGEDCVDLLVPGSRPGTKVLAPFVTGGEPVATAPTNAAAIAETRLPLAVHAASAVLLLPELLRSPRLTTKGLPPGAASAAAAAPAAQQRAASASARSRRTSSPSFCRSLSFSARRRLTSSSILAQFLSSSKVLAWYVSAISRACRTSSRKRSSLMAAAHRALRDSADRASAPSTTSAWAWACMHMVASSSNRHIMASLAASRSDCATAE